MTHHNDPNMNRRPDLGTRGASDGNTTGWVIGGIAAIALLAVGYYAMSGNSSQMANDMNRPVVTAPAATPPVANAPATTGSAPSTMGSAPATTGSAPTTTGSGATGKGTTPPVAR